MCRIEKLEEPISPRNGAKPIYYYLDENGCYVCISHRHDRDGYARIDRNGKEWQLHRYIFSITYGDIPDKMVIRHKCDTPECCNPAHLEIGTQLENMRDIILRNRARKKPHRLTAEERSEIEKSEKTITQLAKDFSVSNAAIIMIKRKARVIIQSRLAKDKPSLNLPNTSTKTIKKASKK